MITLREIDHLVLRVVDLDRMVAFYTGVLGCTVERRQDAIGLVQLRAGRSLVDLVPGTASSAVPAVRRPAPKAATSTTSAFASSRSTKQRSAATSTRPASLPARPCSASAPRAKARRSTSAIRKATRSS